MTTKNRLLKIASEGSMLTKAVRAIPDKYKLPVIGGGSVLAYVKGKQATEDYKEGRKGRLARQEQAMQMMKMAEAPKQLFSREPGEIFPLASESGAISWRQSYLDGLLANKDAMGKMAKEQLQDLFPVSGGHKHKHGYRQRSMTSGRDAGSALNKAFSGK